jgi:hypothetical protein
MKICDSLMLWLFYTPHQLGSHAGFRSGFGCGGKAKSQLERHMTNRLTTDLRSSGLIRSE